MTCSLADSMFYRLFMLVFCGLKGVNLMVSSVTNVSILWEEGLPKISTKSLIFRPIQQADIPDYQKFYADKKTMELYLGGVRSYEVTAERCEGWINRWKNHLFSAFAIRDVNTDEFVGHVVLGHGDYEGDTEYGFSEVAMVIHHDHWGNKRGSEVALAVAEYAKELFKRGEKVPSDVTDSQQEEVKDLIQTGGVKDCLRGENGKIKAVFLPFKEIRATASKANLASYKILLSLIDEADEVRISKKGSDRKLFQFKLGK
ncbi:GNAT family N-acetyltransferase [Chlamydiales bacterium]|nr:GNAT family N-acetyltransferase [Chlamydiales bacterium]